MVNINLNKPGELEVQIAFPSSWDELLPNEIFEIAKQILKPDTPAEETRSAILLFFIESRAKLQKIKLPKTWKKLIDPEDFFINGNALLDFVYNENLLTNPPINLLILQGTRPYHVYAPDKGFESLSCGEFEDCEVDYHKFLNEQLPKHLASLASKLWRPAGTKYQTKDKDGRLISYAHDKWMPMFLKLPDFKLYSLFIWYSGSRNLMSKMFPVAYEPSGEEKESTEPDMLAFTKCIHAGAGPRNGTRDDIRLIKLFEFMYDMNLEAQKAKDLKASMNDSNK